MTTAIARPVIIATALLPVFAANLCYLVSVNGGHIPACFVYIDGCTSISATGRYGVSYWLFKALMFPQAVLLWMFWRQARAGLAVIGIVWARRIWWSGVIAAAFLVLYIIFLGTSGDIYRLMRRYGVFVFFLGTFVAQIAATRVLARNTAVSARVILLQRGLLVLMGVLAVAELPLGTFGLEDDRAENIIEWNFALLMQAWFLTWLGVVRPAPPGRIA